LCVLQQRASHEGAGPTKPRHQHVHPHRRAHTHTHTQRVCVCDTPAHLHVARVAEQCRNHGCCCRSLGQLLVIQALQVHLMACVVSATRAGVMSLMFSVTCVGVTCQCDVTDTHTHIAHSTPPGHP
jgi:hypothetical protein